MAESLRLQKKRQKINEEEDFSPAAKTLLSKIT
jgi:hypothetical protein